jgi:hypothetical protein
MSSIRIIDNYLFCSYSNRFLMTSDARFYLIKHTNVTRLFIILLTFEGKVHAVDDHIHLFNIIYYCQTAENIVSHIDVVYVTVTCDKSCVNTYLTYDNSYIVCA